MDNDLGTLVGCIEGLYTELITGAITENWTNWFYLIKSPNQTVSHTSEKAVSISILTSKLFCFILLLLLVGGWTSMFSCIVHHCKYNWGVVPLLTFRDDVDDEDDVEDLPSWLMSTDAVLSTLLREPAQRNCAIFSVDSSIMPIWTWGRIDFTLTLIQQMEKKWNLSYHPKVMKNGQAKMMEK